MIRLSQPGGAGDLAEDGTIFVGTLCYLRSDATEDWHWTLKAPDGSISQLSSLLSFHPNFPPDVPGTYKITFQSGKNKVQSLTVKAV